MRNSKVTKILIMIIMSTVLVALMIGQVKADDYQDLGTAINGTASNSASNNTAGNNTARNSAASTLNSSSRANNTLTTNSQNSANTANSSTYNSTSLPKSGIGDYIPVVVLAVVFAISAAYAFKKIRDYKNI